MSKRFSKPILTRLGHAALIICITLLSALTMSAATAPTITVHGTVTSEADGEPLIQATVKIKGTKTVTFTDIDGKYTIKAPKGSTLVFSYIGFKTTEATADKATVDVVMAEDFTALDEMVVVGYGTMKRSDLTGSVVSVSDTDMKKTIVTSVDQALQGRAAGVQVTQNSGAPGGGISVAIRGTNSLNGNEPLT